MKILGAFVILLTLSAPGLAAAQIVACPQFFPSGRPPVFLNPRLSQRATFLCNDAYAVVVSGVTHGAIWSAEHPSVDSLAAARQTPRQGVFHPEDRLPEADQAQLEDYRRTGGYDRGHMTPSGDMPDAQAQQQSFSLANMVPQTSNLNRGIWEGIESAVRDLAVHEGDLYVVTGPAFRGSEIHAIGMGSVLVPTDVWKAIYDSAAGTAGAYICTNTASPQCSAISVARLAEISGIDPFPALSARAKQIAMQLPGPNSGPYTGSSKHKRHRRPRSLLDQFIRQLGASP
jgi:endonuclease G